MSLGDLRVAVIGGGIGGMAAAVACALRGAQVQVFEQAPALEEVGAGLQISANGQVVLRALGIDPDPLGYGAGGTLMCDGPSGRTVALLPPPDAGATRYMHRADLLAALVARAEEVGVEIVLGRVVTPGTVQADLIIAADGGQSLWRSHVDGPVEPAFAGQVAWRALVPCDPAVKTGQAARLAI